MSVPRSWRRLDGRFFARDTLALARALIGTVLVNRAGGAACGGRIVETEAYLGQADPASHSFRGPTPRNASMFGRAGTAYVYRIYGVHACFNVVTGARGVGEAVLVRALEPLLGLEAMCARRGTEAPRDLCRGPGRLAQALGIRPQDDARSLLRGPLGIWSDGAGPRAAEILVTPRVGITSAQDLPLRFVLRGSRFASRRS